MGQKRACPLDDPPTASSSDSEEDSEALSHDEQPSSQQRQHENQEDASSEELEDDDDEEEEEAEDAPPPPPVIKPQPFVTNSHSQPSSSESATESDSDPPSSTVAANPKVKPLSSKRMEETPKSKPRPSATPAKSASKRPSENNGHLIDPKRAKKNVMDATSDDDEDEIPLAAASTDGKKNGDDSKKQSQRLWSEEDEIEILKGMVEFSSKTRMDPNKDANAFYDFVKKSLHADATSNQLKQKIRRLKKKFEVNSGKGKSGEGPSFIKLHDQKAFELSKKIWAKDGGGAAANVVERLEKAKSNGKARNNSQKEGKNNVASPKPKAETLPLDSTEPEKMVDIDETDEATLHLSEMIRFDKGLGLSGFNEDVVKRGLELIGGSKRTELEQRWKKLQVTELELYAKRAELIQDQAKLILEVYKASNH